ncbi:MAG: hypothetical protein JKY81_10765 [Colwellia sp.]|nr:hypothetical protein [Colwellia sp.]
MKKIILTLLSSQILFGCGGSGSTPEKPEVIVEQPNIDEQIHDEIPTVNYQSSSIIEQVNFNSRQAIDYTEAMFDADFDLHWQRIGDNVNPINGVAKIIDVNGDMKLAITSLKGQVRVGIHAGKNLTEANELYFLYELTFNADYDFAKGGKLPGLGGLNLSDTNEIKPTGCRVEGQLADRGFSLRSMFREGGAAILYTYHQNNPNIALGDGKACGETFAYQHNGKDFSFQKAKTYLIEQYVKINDANQANGIVTIHVNGFKVLEKTDMVFSENGQYSINQLFIDIWHGGSTSNWAPSVDSTVVIDNIVLSDAPLTYSNN